MPEHPKQECVPIDRARVDSVMWYSIVIAVTIALAISAFVLSLHSAFPHKDAAHKAEVLLVNDQIRDLRKDIKELTAGIARLHATINNIASSSQER